MRKCILSIPAAVLALVLTAGAASADPMAAAFVAGPDSGFDIDMVFRNLSGSTSDIVSIVLDGSTATAFPILWDDLGSRSGPSGAGVSELGENTQVATFNFSNSPSGFNPGESMSLSNMDPDGVPTPVGVLVSELLGVTVTFYFSDQSVLTGVFVDDPAEREGLVWQQTEDHRVPEPATLALLAVGGLGVAWRRRRRAA